MRCTITEEDTWCGPKLHFMGVVRTKMRIALTTKDTKEGKIGFAFKEEFKRRSANGGSRRHSIYEIDSGFKCEVPEAFWDMRLS